MLGNSLFTESLLVAFANEIGRFYREWALKSNIFKVKNGLNESALI